MKIILQGKTEVFTVAHSEMQCFYKQGCKMSMNKYADFFSSVIAAHILSKFQEGEHYQTKLPCWSSP